VIRSFFCPQFFGQVEKHLRPETEQFGETAAAFGAMMLEPLRMQHPPADGRRYGDKDRPLLYLCVRHNQISLEISDLRFKISD